MKVSHLHTDHLQLHFGVLARPVDLIRGQDERPLRTDGRLRLSQAHQPGSVRSRRTDTCDIFNRQSVWHNNPSHLQLAAAAQIDDAG